MLEQAISMQPQDFKDFDRTKNVQGQLQEMVNKKTKAWQLLMDLKDWCEDPYGYGTMPFPRQVGDLNKWADYIETLIFFEQG